MDNFWVLRLLRSDHVKVIELFAYWEVACDPISDDYTPEEITASPLFDIWVMKVCPLYPDGLIPIYWFVSGQGFMEFMPHEYSHYDIEHESLLTYFTHPIHKQTGKKLNWVELPVKDKLWDGKHCSKGGFIQSATGWKPSALQPFVYLPALIEARHLKGE